MAVRWPLHGHTATHKSDKVAEEQQAREMDEVKAGSTIHNP